jgi:hypothetical protein
MTGRSKLIDLLPAVIPLLLLLVVAGLTVAASRDSSLNGFLAASPRQIEQGEGWRLVTSGLLAERPFAASIVSFALLACLALVVCGRKVFWSAALLGHVGSALLPYSLIVLSRQLDQNAFQAAWAASDYGVSAISASWLGALAAIGWRLRGGTRAGRWAIALGCSAVALFAYMLRPGLTILTSEHLVAFIIGVTVARVFFADSATASEAHRIRRELAILVRFSKRMSGRAPWLGPVDPVAVGVSVTTIVLVGASIMPSALGSLGQRLLHDERIVPACVGSGPAGVFPAGAISCATVRNTHD